MFYESVITVTLKLIAPKMRKFFIVELKQTRLITKSIKWISIKKSAYYVIVIR